MVFGGVADNRSEADKTNFARWHQADGQDTPLRGVRLSGVRSWSICE